MMLMIRSAHPSTANRPQRWHDPYFWNDWVACSREWAYASAKYATWEKIFENVFESTEEASSSFGALVSCADLRGAYDSPRLSACHRESPTTASTHHQPRLQMQILYLSLIALHILILLIYPS
jgi:hypothetical protein